MSQFIIKSDFKINDYITLEQNKNSSCSLTQLGLSWMLGVQDKLYYNKFNWIF